MDGLIQAYFRITTSNGDLCIHWYPSHDNFHQCWYTLAFNTSPSFSTLLFKSNSSGNDVTFVTFKVHKCAHRHDCICNWTNSMHFSWALENHGEAPLSRKPWSVLLLGLISFVSQQDSTTAQDCANTYIM